MRTLVRLIRRSPGTTLASTLSIALGIGAVTAIFSVVHGVVIDPFPYKDVGALMSVRAWSPDQPRFNTGYTVDQFQAIASRNHIFSATTFSTISDIEWTGHGDPRRLRGNHTTFDKLARNAVRRDQYITRIGVRAAPFALSKNSRKTESGAISS